MVAAACEACRNKHLKCDGNQVCGRCTTENIECRYVKSRRGYKGPRREKQQRTQSLQYDNLIRGMRPSHGAEFFHEHLGFSRDAGQDQSTPASVALQSPSSSAGVGSLRHNLTIAQQTLNAEVDVAAEFVEAYYFYSHAAHPFLMPRAHMLPILQTRSLHHLETVMKYIGASYISQAATRSFAQGLEKELYGGSYPQDGFMVQAMLLFAIGLDANNQQQRASQVLRDAQDLAQALGLQRREFASINGEGSAALEESWRRTWWELYVVDGMFAGVHKISSSKLASVSTDVLLPCEEIDYVAGVLPPARSLKDYDDNCFLPEETCFSSYTYRIDIIRILHQVLEIPQPGFPDDPAVDSADTCIANWVMNLPTSKRFSLTESGQNDEMMFQAHMIANAATILLHRQRSSFDSFAVQQVNSCAPPASSTNHGQIHAVKAIQAAGNISKLITLPTPLTHHSHFFTCVVTLAAIVYLSQWSSTTLHVAENEIVKKRLQLAIGALNAMSEVWPIAGMARGQVKSVAQELFAAKETVPANPLFGILTDDEMLRSIMNEEMIDESENGSWGITTN
ncbi:MAG: hypothetical protein M1812_007174 [Candelaria pacifica]|nr:MAG: hypothetical protein M1812_007174 [Candelaria pacifica]